MNLKSTLIGSTMLVVLLTAGAAQSLSGSNTVYTDDIVNGQVYGGDLANSAVTGSKIYNNTVTGTDVNEATLVPTCRSGLTKVGDVCFGSQRAAAGFGAAIADCIDERLRLPTISEGRLIASSLNSDTFIWVDSAFKNGDAFGAAIAKSDSYGLADNAFSNIPYHCVTTVGARP